MKLTYFALMTLAFSTVVYAAAPNRLPDMPRDPRSDSACINKTTATTAGNCPRQVFSPGKNQAIEGYSPIYHQQYSQQ